MRIQTTLLLVLIWAGQILAKPEIDQRPLAVGIEQVVDKNQWPDWLTGHDRGLNLDVRPVVITGAGDGSKRLFVATQSGTVHVLTAGEKFDGSRLFLDLRDRVDFQPADNEEGFLGMCFHPRYRENGQFVVCYTAKPTKEHPRLSIISRFRTLPGDLSRGDPQSEEILLRIPQPYNNHNGGTVVFGPDGLLYIVVGDGGAGGDPHNYAQSLETPYAKVLRIDIDRQENGTPYAIPRDNPFINRPGARPETWAYGLRNVWRLSFDRATGVCWGADVGQDDWEEINLIRRGGNYGWSLREGRHDFHWYRAGSGPRPDLIEPIWEYSHKVGNSITGGCVYRGKALPALEGAYLYGDYVTGKIWALWYDAATQRVTANRLLQASGMPIMTFGEDDDGEVYFSTQGGEIKRFVE